MTPKRRKVLLIRDSCRTESVEELIAQKDSQLELVVNHVIIYMLSVFTITEGLKLLRRLVTSYQNKVELLSALPVVVGVVLLRTIIIVHTAILTICDSKTT